MNNILNITDNKQDIILTFWTLPGLAGNFKSHIESNLIFNVKMIELFILNFVCKLINKILIY